MQKTIKTPSFKYEHHTKLKILTVRSAVPVVPAVVIVPVVVATVVVVIVATTVVVRVEAPVSIICDGVCLEQLFL